MKSVNATIARTTTIKKTIAANPIATDLTSASMAASS